MSRPEPEWNLDRERERYTRIAAMNGWSPERRAAFVEAQVAEHAEQNAWLALQHEAWRRGNGAGIGRHYGTAGLSELLAAILTAESATVEAASTLLFTEMKDGAFH